MYVNDLINCELYTVGEYVHYHRSSSMFDEIYSDEIYMGHIKGLVHFVVAAYQRYPRDISYQSSRDKNRVELPTFLHRSEL